MVDLPLLARSVMQPLELGGFVDMHTVYADGVSDWMVVRNLRAGRRSRSGA